MRISTSTPSAVATAVAVAAAEAQKALFAPPAEMLLLSLAAFADMPQVISATPAEAPIAVPAHAVISRASSKPGVYVDGTLSLSTNKVGV